MHALASLQDNSVKVSLMYNEDITQLAVQGTLLTYSEWMAIRAQSSPIKKP